MTGKYGKRHGRKFAATRRRKRERKQARRLRMAMRRSPNPFSPNPLLRPPPFDERTRQNRAREKGRPLVGNTNGGGRPRVPTAGRWEGTPNTRAHAHTRTAEPHGGRRHSWRSVPRSDVWVPPRRREEGREGGNTGGRFRGMPGPRDCEPALPCLLVVVPRLHVVVTAWHLHLVFFHGFRHF